MQADIITIGDEILIGQVADTNSTWIAARLNDAGIHVNQITSIRDEEQHIITSMDRAAKRSEVIILTGGLGPTRDDITKATLCKYFNTKLVLDEQMLSNVEAYVKSRGAEMNDLNRRQAEVPEDCRAIRNRYGTAPGMLFRKDGKTFISLPGVPYEMKDMMEREVLPLLAQMSGGKRIMHKNILTHGIPESSLAELLADWEDSVRNKGIKLAYLPSPGMIRLRLSVEGENGDALKGIVNPFVEELHKIIPGHILAEEDKPIENLVADALLKSGRTIGTAESCTGGYLAHLITSVPGSSGYFKGSVIAYQNEIKTSLLGVKKKDICEHGAVSSSVVKQMADGAKELLNADYALATSGIAGPGGGTAHKPPGTVWIALASGKGVHAEKFSFAGNRQRNIRKTAVAAFGMLLAEIST